MKLSIVVAAWTGERPVLNCLRSLEQLPEFEDIDIIVADCCGVEAKVRSAHPRVKIVAVPSNRSIAQSRHDAIRHASADVIAVLHERYAVKPDWASAVLASHQSDCDVAGGCVRPSDRLSPAGWAMYLSEYSHIAPPLPSGPMEENEAAMLPGGNISYKRRVFAMADMGRALWELDFHASLLKAGARFERQGKMDAEFSHSFTVREYVAERYRISRDFAAQRAASLPMWKRLVTGAARLALPGLVVGRIATRAVKGPYRTRFFQAMPWITAFSIVQTAGEMAGYLSRPDKAA